MKSSICFAIILGFFIAISCNKTDSKSAKELLTNKTWKVSQSAIDQNNNGILDGTEIYSRDSTLTLKGRLNDNGTGSLTFITADTSGSAAFTWSLDATNTFITTSIATLGNTMVSKILTIDERNLSVVLDTSAVPKTFVFFEEE